MSKPEGAQIFYKGAYYKIGRHGKPYIYCDECGWIRSVKDPVEIRQAIDYPGVRPDEHT